MSASSAAAADRLARLTTATGPEREALILAAFEDETASVREQAGTGTFWAMAYILGLGFNMTRATAYTKVMNFASNLGSLVFFLLGGNVFFVAGLVMGVGQLLGARIGSRMVIRKGTRFIRPVFLAVVLALTLKLLYDSFWK